MVLIRVMCQVFFSSRRRHTRCSRDWSSDVCSSDLESAVARWWNRAEGDPAMFLERIDRKSTRLNSSHGYISYAVFCLKKIEILTEADQVGTTQVYTTSYLYLLISL